MILAISSLRLLFNKCLESTKIKLLDGIAVKNQTFNKYLIIREKVSIRMSDK